MHAAKVLDISIAYFEARITAVLFESALRVGCVLGSHGLGSHLVVPPTGNPPIGLGNRSLSNWDEAPT
jgi:hypothetical protein